MKKRRIGVDLDNTIACYERVFEPIAQQMGLISKRPEGWTKLQIREALQKKGRNDLWTQLQGEVYGPGMRRATPFAGVLEDFFEAQKCNRAQQGTENGTQSAYDKYHNQLPRNCP